MPNMRFVTVVQVVCALAVGNAGKVSAPLPSTQPSSPQSGNPLKNNAVPVDVALSAPLEARFTLPAVPTFNGQPDPEILMDAEHLITSKGNKTAFLFCCLQGTTPLCP
jgi:hypothetical protein